MMKYDMLPHDEYAKKIQEIRSYSEAPICESSPFNRDLKENIKFTIKKQFYKQNATTTGKGKDLIDKGSFEESFAMTEYISGNPKKVEVNKVFHSVEKKEKDPFIKLYIDNLKHLFDLSLTAVKLYFYILSSLKVNDYLVFVDPQDAMDVLGYKQTNPYYRGMTELIKKQFIALTPKKNFVFINPKYAFNGSRMFIIKEVIMEDKEISKMISNPRRNNDILPDADIEES